MPQVPRYDEQTRLAPAPEARVGAQTPAEAFGGGAAAAGAAQEARGMARDVAGFALEERLAADSLVVQQADLDTAQEKIRLLKDPKTGALGVKGQETLGLPDTVGKSFDDFTKKIAGRLTSAQRRDYDRAVFGHKRDINDTLQTHIFSEMRRFDEATTNARLETAREEAVLNFTDPSKVQFAIKLQTQLLRARANRDDLAGQAIPPEELARQVEEAASKTHTSVIGRMLTAGSYQGAREYLDRVPKGELTSADTVNIDQALRAGTIRGESQRHASDIMGTAKSEAAALESARDITDPDIQKATVEEVRIRYAEQRRIEKDIDDAAMQSASNLVETSHDARAVPPPLWARLSASDRRALEVRSRQLREGVEPVTDWVLYHDLPKLPGFAKEDMTRYRARLADSEYKELIGMQRGIARDGEKALDGYRTKTQIVNDGIASMGVDPTPKPGDAAENVATFRNLVDQEIRQTQRQTGKEATNEQVQKIVDGLVIKARTPSATFLSIPIPFTGGEKRAYELQATKKSDIPQAESIKLEAKFKAAGVHNPSDDDMVEAYNLTIRRRIAGAPRAP
jgi:hypothetical protein